LLPLLAFFLVTPATLAAQEGAGAPDLASLEADYEAMFAAALEMASDQNAVYALGTWGMVVQSAMSLEFARRQAAGGKLLALALRS